MNERAYDIALEVLEDYPVINSWTFTRTELAEFAERIVRECAAVCDEYAMPDGTSITAQILSIAIKRRFGIEL
jgi:hypothetical protein